MADVLGSNIDDYWRNFLQEKGVNDKLSTNEWVVSDRLDAETGQYFTSWKDFFGPAGRYGGDYYTKMARALFPMLNFFPSRDSI